MEEIIYTDKFGKKFILLSNDTVDRHFDDLCQFCHEMSAAVQLRFFFPLKHIALASKLMNILNDILDNVIFIYKQKSPM